VQLTFAVIVFYQPVTLQAAAVALSALINALYETNCAAIVRRVYARNGAVRIGALVPQIDAENEVCVQASLFYYIVSHYDVPLIGN
jgi:hypothetical protein